ncbi:HPr kinase [Cnuibacter physcomitrellae]|uniref:3-oxo-tetronate kinase n=1 Tax=Cnuibacter physcomitrellae TaxID=1619308 RepID=A0A1X9LNQ8_9MICO|nr:3-oxo-tetronate kinase [Cnuibacter physcomitrellae]ARJ06826.1 hypothetical protein B5808_17565 [Cnuibacter physcomitrellae]GGI38928.1 HPr kinase [Cnuibacter physcomitrellae]
MIGAIADDFTGATDIAVAFRRVGLSVGIRFSLEDVSEERHHEDVVIVALKTRTIAPSDAVAQSMDALDWLREQGATQIFFKYCSTFDSRADGNIGPVADALGRALAATRVVFVPASPRHLRTQYMGHLYVDQKLLSDSSMRDHPLTPMTDSFLPRVLAHQTAHPVALLDHRDVARGVENVSQRLAETAHEAGTYVVVDAIDDADLLTIGAACVDDILVTGAAGLAEGWGAAHAARAGARPDASPAGSSHEGFTSVVLAGSCSARTLEQVAHMMQKGHPALQLDAITYPDPAELSDRALAWYGQQDPASAPLIYSTMPAEELHHVQDVLGAEGASRILEGAMGRIASGLVERGVNRLIVAGGETSGSVTTALGVVGGAVGPEAAPGVPWIVTAGPRPLTLLLKSGNFGDPLLLTRAATSV